MASPLKEYFARSADVLRKRTSNVLRFDPSRQADVTRIFSFHKPPVTPVSEFATGSDKDIGGVSTCALTPVAGPPTATGEPTESHIAFHGNLSLHVPSEFRGRIRTGYAAFRNKSKPTIFGEDTWDLDLHSHLRVEVAYRGWEQWRGRWVCNIQTDGPVKTDLFQHRLDLPAEYATSETRALNPATATGLNFTTLYLPLSNFVLTNSGRTSETQVEMMREKIRTVGFALLGGGRASDAPSDAQVAVAQHGAITGAGGFGRPDPNEEPDAELAELIASDLGDRPVNPSGQPAGPGKYHRVGAASAPNGASAPDSLLGTNDISSGEGYYELCVRSVEAVKYDPELD